MAKRLGPGRVRDALLPTGAFDALSGLGLRWIWSATNQLDRLSVLYRTDKSAREHGYTEFYERHFAPIRFRKIVIVEIGVGGYDDPESGGSSLRVWRDYFPRSKVYGVDITPKRLRHLGRRVSTIEADQSSPESLRAVLDVTGPPDVIIDDGSHVGSHIWTTFETLYPALQPGGWYVIEDLHTSYMAKWGGDPAAGPSTAIGLLRQVLDSPQAQDPTFVRLKGALAARPSPNPADVIEVHTYPGISFLRKSSSG